MLVIMKRHCPEKHIDHVEALLDRVGADHWLIDSSEPPMVEVLGGADRVSGCGLEDAPMVDRIVPGAGPILAIGRRPGDRTREIRMGAGATVGGKRICVIAGPCSVESRSQLLETAAAVKEAGATALRGGAFKPRTSPYSFQGLGERGLELLALARDETGLAVVTEVMSPQQIDLVARYADVLQVGSRNMHNSSLLAAVGRQPLPVLLKRGWSATLDEFLLAAEYVMKEGNPNVILCERGIRTHETYVRNTLALAVVPEIKHRSRLPIIVDPSHATGHRHLVGPMSNAAVACGADGLLIEVHRTPAEAWCDGEQSLDLDDFRGLMGGLRLVAKASEREA